LFLSYTEAFDFGVVLLSNFSFVVYALMLLVSYTKKVIAKTHVKKLFPHVFLLGVLWFPILHSSLKFILS